MPAFALHQLVRPSRSVFLSKNKDGTQVDWNGVASAQGWIYDVGGGADPITGANDVWDPSTSTLAPNSTGGAQRYGVTVWDIAAQAFVNIDYPEAELAAATLEGGSPVSVGPWPDPTLDGGENAANIARSRT